MESESRQAGFTLTEVVVAVTIVAIMSAALAPLAVQQMSRARETATVERMTQIVDGMLGGPASGRHGYLGDMGQLPPDLQSLIVRGAQPAFGLGASGIGTGWNGPYVHHMGAVTAISADSWGNPFTYAVTAQLTSPGADRQLGTADDISLPNVPAPTVGNLVVTVLGIPNTGPPPMVLDNVSGSAVAVSFSNNGVAAQRALVWNGSAFADPGVHLGAHAITASGLNAWAGATAVTVVEEVAPGTNSLTLTLVQP